MKDPMDDAERIAALLDGRLTPQQRDEVLARLGQSDAALEALVDAAAVLRDKRTRRWRWRAPVMALAACIVAAVAIFPVLRGRGTRDGSSDPGRYAAILVADHVVVPADWNGTPWPTTRGADEPLRAEARATRLGARLTDLDLAVRAGDTSASRIAVDVATLLDPLPASAPVVAMYRALTRADANTKERDSLLVLARPSTAALAGRQAVDLGAWIEAARLAAAQHDSVFFQSAESREMLTRTRLSLTNWNTFETELSNLLRSLGS